MVVYAGVSCWVCCLFRLLVCFALDICCDDCLLSVLFGACIACYGLFGCLFDCVIGCCLLLAGVVLILLVWLCLWFCGFWLVGVWVRFVLVCLLICCVGVVLVVWYFG